MRTVEGTAPKKHESIPKVSQLRKWRFARQCGLPISIRKVIGGPGQESNLRPSRLEDSGRCEIGLKVRRGC